MFLGSFTSARVALVLDGTRTPPKHRENSHRLHETFVFVLFWTNLNCNNPTEHFTEMPHTHLKCQKAAVQ